MLGGGGSSSSNQTSTQQIDKRLVVDAGIGISSDSSTVSVNALDGGAVKESLATAGEAISALSSVSSLALTGGAKTVADVLGFASSVFSKSFDALDRSGKIIEGGGVLVAKAYDDAKGDGTQKTYIAVAALAVVAVVAVKAWGK